MSDRFVLSEFLKQKKETLYGPLNSKGCFIVKVFLKENETYLKGKVGKRRKTTRCFLIDMNDLK